MLNVIYLKRGAFRQPIPANLFFGVKAKERAEKQKRQLAPAQPPEMPVPRQRNGGFVCRSYRYCCSISQIQVVHIIPFGHGRNVNC